MFCFHNRKKIYIGFLYSFSFFFFKGSELFFFNLKNWLRVFICCCISLQTFPCDDVRCRHSGDGGGRPAESVFARSSLSFLRMKEMMVFLRYLSFLLDLTDAERFHFLDPTLVGDVILHLEKRSANLESIYITKASFSPPNRRTSVQWPSYMKRLMKL